MPLAPRKYLVAATLAVTLLTLAAVSTSPVAADHHEEDGFVSIFDGKTLEGWRGFKQETAPEGWVVEDGAIVRRDRGGDLITDKQYANFELRIEWKVAEGANSGIMYRVTEDQKVAYLTGAEYQILDNDKHHDGKNPFTSAASLYGLYVPQDAELKPVGEYNTTRIVLRGNHVEHWLNGKKVVECELKSDDWNERLAKSKFAKWGRFAKNAKGHIVLQDHGDLVHFRNIRIKEFDD